MTIYAVTFAAVKEKYHFVNLQEFIGNLGELSKSLFFDINEVNMLKIMSK